MMSSQAVNRRQTAGGETWRRLREWDRGQTPSERLAAQILRFEEYTAIDPSHPLGGRDGLKDLICKKDGKKFIAASYFPRGQQTKAKIEKKFKEDLEGVKKNNADGIAFVTNQELSLSERRTLEELASPADLDLFHLERLASVLDSPQFYGIRLDFLDIEMTKEEQLAFMAVISQLKDSLETLLSVINKSKLLKGELEKVISQQDNHNYPPIVTSMNPSLMFPNTTVIKCSYCSYGYIGQKTSFNSMGENIFVCPKCGNAESHRFLF